MNNQESLSEQSGTEKKPAGHSYTAASSAAVQMSLSLVVECPHCGKDHNLASSELDDECQFTSAVFKDSYDWRDGLRGMEFECPDCNETFLLGDIQY